MFDVDDEDEIDGSSSLLEELEIDLEHIYTNVVWSLLGPLHLVLASLRRRYYKNSAMSSLLAPPDGGDGSGLSSSDDLLGASTAANSSSSHANGSGHGHGHGHGHAGGYSKIISAAFLSVISVVTDKLHPLHSSHCQVRAIFSKRIFI